MWGWPSGNTGFGSPWFFFWHSKHVSLQKHSLTINLFSCCKKVVKRDMKRLESPLLSISAVQDSKDFPKRQTNQSYNLTQSPNGFFCSLPERMSLFAFILWHVFTRKMQFFQADTFLQFVHFPHFGKVCQDMSTLLGPFGLSKRAKRYGKNAKKEWKNVGLARPHHHRCWCYWFWKHISTPVKVSCSVY